MNHTQAKADLAEAKAKQGEAKAKQAENVAAHHISELKSVYASKSWRVTAPLRWIFTQTKLLSTNGPKPRIKALIKKVLRKTNHELFLRPALRNRLKHWSYKLGFHPLLKWLLTKASDRPQSIENQFTNSQSLSPQARQIFNDLKQGIEKQHSKFSPKHREKL